MRLEYIYYDILKWYIVLCNAWFMYFLYSKSTLKYVYIIFSSVTPLVYLFAIPVITDSYIFLAMNLIDSFNIFFKFCTITNTYQCINNKKKMKIVNTHHFKWNSVVIYKYILIAKRDLNYKIFTWNIEYVYCKHQKL